MPRLRHTRRRRRERHHHHAHEPDRGASHRTDQNRWSSRRTRRNGGPADTAFAFACNSHNQRAVAPGCAIEFLAPARLGDGHTAEGVEVAPGGRGGV